MELMVPANYDLAILPELGRSSVSEIYGRLPGDVVGGGRPNYMGSAISKRRLRSYIAAVQDQGMAFNYLLNSACLGNREWTRSFHRELRQLLDWIAESGVRKLTVAAPYLVQLIRREYPQFAIKVGIYAQVDTVKRAQYWEDLGVEAIVLESFSINRHFELLKRIRQSVKCGLTLIANHFCQPNCPYQIQHQNGHAHASGDDCRFFLDFPLLQCQAARLQEPRLMIAAPWIRPEDLRAYEEIGYTSFKLLERDIPSAELLKRVHAYQRRQFKGNLAELIFSWGFSRRAPGFKLSHFVRWFKPWKLRPQFQRSVATFLASQGMLGPVRDGNPPIEIRGDLLPNDFLEWFRNKDCSNMDCASCGFCEKVAKKVVRIDPAFLADALPRYKRLQEQLLAGQF